LAALNPIVGAKSKVGEVA
jgi:hypothetical protein